jgi:branched-chain amino acid transport system substrate-binding protein
MCILTCAGRSSWEKRMILERQNRIRRTTYLVLVVVLALGLVAACKGKVTAPEVIRIGVIAYSDEEIERVSTINAAEMAVGEINGSGGIRAGEKSVQVIWIKEEVRGGVPEESVAAIQRLINQEKVVAIVGPQYSSDAIPAGEVAERSSIPLISPISTNPKTTLDRKSVFRMGFLDDFQGKVAATFMMQKLKKDRAAVIYNIANPYSRGIAEVFKDHYQSQGGSITAFEPYTSLEDALEERVDRVIESRPHVVYIPNFSSESAAIARLARSKGIKVPFMGGDGWDRTNFSSTPDFEGSYMTAHYSADIDTPANIKFTEEYKKRFGLVPGDTAALTYDAFHMIFSAIRKQGRGDPGSIRDGLYNMGPYEGVGGPVDFVENGDPEKGAVILQLTSSGPQFVQIVDAD